MSLALTTQLYVNGAWTTYASYSESAGWSVRIGPDPETGTQPNQVSFVLANDDLSMDPTNPESAIYGQIGRNTLARIRIDGLTLSQGEASSWEPERTVEHVPGTGVGLSSMSVTAEGLLRRLSRWEDPLDSPMRRQTNSYSSLLGHWPLEDASGAAVLANDVTGGAAGTYSGTVSLAADSGAGGSGACLTIGSDAQLGGRFGKSTASGYQIVFSAKLAAQPSTAAEQNMFTWVDSAGRTWKWGVNNTNFIWTIVDPDGSTVLSNLTTSYGTNTVPNQWIRYRMRVTVSGGTLTYEPAWYVQDASSVVGVTNTFASSTTGQPRDWRVYGNSWTDGAAYTGVFALTDTALNITSTYDVYAAFNGYLAERAGARFSRLMSEQGLNHYVDGDSTVSAPMGRQKPARLLDLIEECRVTDAGLVYDEPLDGSGLTFRLNNALINQAPTLALTYGVDVTPPLAKTIDDVGVANDITATNWDGSQVRVELTTGRLSVSPPPAGVGRYKLPLDVSMASGDDVANRVNWELANKTIDKPRYKAVSVDLVRNSSLRTTVTGMRPGHLITLTGVEADTVTLMVMTIGRSGDTVRDTAVLRCVPADVYLTGTYDDTTYRYDSGSTTLKTGVNSSAVSLTFRTTDFGDLWSTADVPYDVLVAGERITVTSMGAASLVSGAYDQVATVTRSANGIAKSLSAGEEIHVATPGRWAL